MSVLFPVEPLGGKSAGCQIIVLRVLVFTSFDETWLLNATPRLTPEP